MIETSFMKELIAVAIHSITNVSLIVSATRRRGDIKIPLCLSAPVRKSLMIEPWTHAQVRFFCFRPEIPLLGKFGQKKNISKLSV